MTSVGGGLVLVKFRLEPKIEDSDSVVDILVRGAASLS